MRLSIKHLIIGALIASIPTFSWAVTEVQGNEEPQQVSLSTSQITNLDVEFPSPNKNNLTITPTPAANPTTNPKKVEKPADTKPLVIESETPSPQTKSQQPENALVQALINKYANMYGASAEIMVKIAFCESGFRANANNGPYGGIYQFHAGTWRSNRNLMGKDPNPKLRYNLEEAIETAAFKMAKDGYSAWPVCSRKAGV